MGLRFDTGGEDIRRTASIHSLSTYSECFWIQLVSDLNILGVMTYRNNSSDGEWILLGVDNDGVTLHTETNGGATNGGALTVGTWYHLALVKNGSSYKVYQDGVEVINRTDSTDITAITQIFVSAFNGSNNVNSRMAAYKIWDGAALTPEEVNAERWSFLPMRTANLWAWLPMVDKVVANCALDRSGNARNFTVTSTPTVEDGPPISWASSRTRRYLAPSGIVAPRFILGTH